MARHMITSKSVGPLAAWFVVLAMVEGCAEAPRTSADTETVEVVRETKDARKADACIREAASSEGPEARPVDDETADEEQVTEPRPEAEDEAETELVSDVMEDEALDASNAPIAARTPDDSDGGTDTSIGDASPASNACDSNPCHHGTCSTDAGQYACACAEGFVGAHCELKICGNVTIRSGADVEESRDCAEIRGSLSISSVGLTAIGADDFPFLTKITGDLMITGAQEAEAPLLDSVTLANLRSVEGAVVVLGVATVEFGSSGPLKELHLPALERIGARGLLVYQAGLRVLDLTALTTIEGGVALHTLWDLCSAEFDAIEHIGGDLVLQDAPRLSTKDFDPLRAAVAGATSESLLGCCASGAEGRVGCESFAYSARVRYCTEC